MNIKPNTIKTSADTIVLKQLIHENAKDYFDLVNFDRQHLSQFGDTTADKYPTLESVMNSIVNPSNPRKLRQGIWYENIMVGSVNLTPKENNSAELGVWIGKQYIGHKYASRALKLLTEYAFKTLGYKLLFGIITIGNEASRKSIEKIGFKLTNTSEESWTYSLYSSEFS